MSTKRPLEDGGKTSSPPPKKVQFEPIQLGAISTLEEMDVKILKFQNHKFYQVRKLLTSCQVSKPIISCTNLL